MDVVIAAVVTGLGLLAGMLVIWRGLGPPQMTTEKLDGSGRTGSRAKQEETS